MENNFNSSLANTEDNTQIPNNQSYPYVNNEQQISCNKSGSNRQQTSYSNNGKDYNANNTNLQQPYGYNSHQGNAYEPQQPPYGNGGNWGNQQQNTYQSGPQQPFNQYPGMNPMGNIPPEPGFIGSIKLFFSQYAQFSGRSRRQEYWYIVLFTFLLDLCLNFTGLSTLSSLVSLAFIIPNLALQCRRLHDIGKSGHWIWLSIASNIIFVVALMYLIIYFITYIPEIHTELSRQGIDPSIFYSLYPLLDIPGWIIVAMVVFAIVVKIIFLVFNCTDSNRGTNQYGPSQKYPDQQMSPW